MIKGEIDHLVRYNIFSEFRFVSGDILVGSCHDDIKKELLDIIEYMQGVKNSKLNWLRSIDTDVIGNQNKRYKIPISIISNIFFSYYLKELGRYYTNQKFPDKSIDVKIQSVDDDKLCTGMWMNFYKKGDATILHDHSSDLSGIVFCSTNTPTLPTTFANGVDIYGNFGDVCIFPSSLEHENGIYMGDDDRITISFNLDVEKK